MLRGVGRPRRAGAPTATPLPRPPRQKQRGCEGPIQDALLDPFLLVVGTQATDFTMREAWLREAKAFATENAQTIIDDAVQILGGRGVLKESMVDLLYRSVRALRIYEGTTEIQHLLVAAQLLKSRA